MASDMTNFLSDDMQNDQQQTMKGKNQRKKQKGRLNLSFSSDEPDENDMYGGQEESKKKQFGNKGDDDKNKSIMSELYDQHNKHPNLIVLFHKGLYDLSVI